MQATVEVVEQGAWLQPEHSGDGTGTPLPDHNLIHSVILRGLISAHSLRVLKAECKFLVEVDWPSGDK